MPFVICNARVLDGDAFTDRPCYVVVAKGKIQAIEAAMPANIGNAEQINAHSGIGFLIINAYSTFNMPRMYALLIVLFVISIGVNALVGRLGGAEITRRGA